MNLMNDQTVSAAFLDELEKIGMEKQAFAPMSYLATGVQHAGTMAKGLSSSAGRKSIHGGLKGLWQSGAQAAPKGSSQWWGGAKAVGKALAPAAAGVGTVGLAGYGAKKAVLG